MPPQVTIIVTCKNPGSSLACALESVWAQRDASCELVVVDGASKDGTPEWLLQQGARIATSISEPDGGVYEAMNKGVRLAQGNWLLFLGADDQLAGPNVLAQVQAQMNQPDEGLFCGEVAYSDRRIWLAPRHPNIYFRNFLHHQATFYRRSLFDRFRYDASLRIQADYDLNLRLWHAGVRPKPLPVRVAFCRAGGLSDGGCWANYHEEIAIRHRYLPAWRCLPWDAGSIARYLRKKIIRRNPNRSPEQRPGIRCAE